MAAALVPELSVTDWQRSLAFYRDILGFEIRNLRPEDGFAHLERDDAELMIDQIGIGRDFETGLMEHPLGRGLNLQIRVNKVAPLLEALELHRIPLVIPLEDRWYRNGAREEGHRQFVVADPDGYLLRFHESLGQRPFEMEEPNHSRMQGANLTDPPK